MTEDCNISCRLRLVMKSIWRNYNVHPHLIVVIAFFIHMKYLLRIYYHVLTHTLPFCCVRWHMEDPGKCSARCGPGYKSRPVRCMRVSNGRWSIVQDKHCPGAKPAVVVPCEGTCEGTRWVYTKWTQVFFHTYP